MNFLYYLIISPIETIVDWVFCFMTNKVYQFGMIGAIVGVSLAINFLALPLYNIADSLQEKERKIAKALEPRVKRIKMAFKGDERFMMLSEYYRQNNYHPLYALRSSLSILIEIPFFIAAYHYLSNCDALKNASFWIFNNLGESDALFSIQMIRGGVFTVNILPILMTLINFVSSLIYLKDCPLREKIQLYGISIVFLVLLYDSPSGLVIYWILNNIFSLVKNIVMKAKNPGKILHKILLAIFVFISIFATLKIDSFVRKSAIYLFTILFATYPIYKNFITKKFNLNVANETSISKSSSVSFVILCGTGLALLAGFVIPSSIISTSPQEFSFLGETDNPSSYVWSSLWVFLGLFVFWPSAIIKMFGEKVRNAMMFIFFVLLTCALANNYIFKFDLGLISTTFQIENFDLLKVPGFFFNILPAIFLVCVLTIFFIIKRFKLIKIANVILLSICIAEFGFGMMRVSSINKEFKEYSDLVAQNKVETEEIKPIYHLSKTEKNVVVLFLDKAINAFFPQILNDFPQLKENFDGFTYYPNTASFGNFTDLASPALLAGYEYTPEKLNERFSELLKDKHNESLLVMPRLFLDAGYSVTITDPPCSNYNGKGDFSEFEPYPQIQVQDIFGKYRNAFFKEQNIADGVELAKADIVTRKEARNFSILQMIYPSFRKTFYSLCIVRSKRVNRDFYDTFSALYFLDRLTDFDSKTGTFTLIDNETTHEPLFLDETFLKVSDKDSTRLEKYYSSNVATIMQVCEFIQKIKENNAFDNTRIIIVADHGTDLKLDRFKDFKNQGDGASFNPLLLVKDFSSSEELKTDNSFMTNADTLFIAKEGLNISNQNPFTKKEFKQEKENGINCYPIVNSEHLSQHMQDKYQFTLVKSKGYKIDCNVLDEKYWTHLDKLNEGVE